MQEGPLQESKHAQLLRRARTKAYDVFLRVAGASTLEELVLPAPSSSSSSSSTSSTSSSSPSACWIWIVNLGENGGSFQEKKDEVQRLFFKEGRSVVWVPLIGKPFSLLRCTSTSLANEIITSHNLTLASPPSSTNSSSKPLFLELARPEVALSHLAVSPDRYSDEGAVEFEPGKRRWPCGVEVWNDFVSEEEEQMLIKKMRELGEWEEGLEKRLSIHYGRHFDYTTNATKEIVRPLPDYVSRILASLPYSDPNHPTDQMTGQLYPAGSGIPPHVDTHSPFGPVIWGISLGSTVTMDLKPCGPVEAARMRIPKRSLTSSTTSPSTPPFPSPSPPPTPPPPPPPSSLEPTLQLSLRPRSLLIMKGASRYGFTHGIRPRRVDPVGEFGEELRPRGERYSLTFRQVRDREVEGGCKCDGGWGDWCDSRIWEGEGGAGREGGC